VRLCNKVKSYNWWYSQPTKELEVVKDALDQQFDYFNHPLAFKYVKEKVAIVFKSRCGWLNFFLRKVTVNLIIVVRHIGIIVCSIELRNNNWKGWQNGQNSKLAKKSKLCWKSMWHWYWRENGKYNFVTMSNSKSLSHFLMSQFNLIISFDFQFTLEEILKSMTPYMTNFVVILDIIWLKALSCIGQVTKNK